MMINKKMFYAGMGLVSACASLILVGCDLNDADTAQPAIPVSFVSLYNASPDAPALDIEVDNRQINSYPFGYADYTGYLQFYTGNREIRFTPHGANNVVADTTVTLVDSQAYSIFVADEYQKASIVTLADSAANAPASGKAMVRVINLSPDLAPASLKEKNAAINIATNLAFKKASGFAEVDAKSYSFQITTAEASEPVLSLDDITLREGGFYTVVVRGYHTPASGDTRVLSAEVVTN